MHRRRAGARVVADRKLVQVGLGHPEQVPDLVQEHVVHDSLQMLPAAGGAQDRQAEERDLGHRHAFHDLLLEQAQRPRLTVQHVLDVDGDVRGCDPRLDPLRQRVELGVGDCRELVLAALERADGEPSA
jgi:hypothetical protein